MYFIDYNKKINIIFLCIKLMALKLFDNKIKK